MSGRFGFRQAIRPEEYAAMDDQEIQKLMEEPSLVNFGHVFHIGRYNSRSAATAIKAFASVQDIGQLANNKSDIKRDAIRYIGNLMDFLDEEGKRENFRLAIDSLTSQRDETIAAHVLYKLALKNPEGIKDIVVALSGLKGLKGNVPLQAQVISTICKLFFYTRDAAEVSINGLASIYEKGDLGEDCISGIMRIAKCYKADTQSFAIQTILDFKTDQAMKMLGEWIRGGDEDNNLDEYAEVVLGGFVAVGTREAINQIGKTVWWNGKLITYACDLLVSIGNEDAVEMLYQLGICENGYPENSVSALAKIRTLPSSIAMAEVLAKTPLKIEASILKLLERRDIFNEAASDRQQLEKFDASIKSFIGAAMSGDTLVERIRLNPDRVTFYRDVFFAAAEAIPSIDQDAVSVIFDLAEIKAQSLREAAQAEAQMKIFHERAFTSVPK